MAQITSNKNNGKITKLNPIFRKNSEHATISTQSRPIAAMTIYNLSVWPVTDRGTSTRVREPIGCWVADGNSDPWKIKLTDTELIQVIQSTPGDPVLRRFGLETRSSTPFTGSMFSRAPSGFQAQSSQSNYCNYRENQNCHKKLSSNVHGKRKVNVFPSLQIKISSDNITSPQKYQKSQREIRSERLRNCGTSKSMHNDLPNKEARREGFASIKSINLLRSQSLKSVSSSEGDNKEEPRDKAGKSTRIRIVKLESPQQYLARSHRPAVNGRRFSDHSASRSINSGDSGLSSEEISNLDFEKKRISRTPNNSPMPKPTDEVIDDDRDSLMSTERQTPTSRQFSGQYTLVRDGHCIDAMVNPNSNDVELLGQSTQQTVTRRQSKSRNKTDETIYPSSCKYNHPSISAVTAVMLGSELSRIEKNYKLQGQCPCNHRYSIDKFSADLCNCKINDGSGDENWTRNSNLENNSLPLRNINSVTNLRQESEPRGCNRKVCKDKRKEERKINLRDEKQNCNNNLQEEKSVKLSRRHNSAIVNSTEQSTVSVNHSINLNRTEKSSQERDLKIGLSKPNKIDVYVPY